jgi:hypothetical protein
MRKTSGGRSTVPHVVPPSSWLTPTTRKTIGLVADAEETMTTR